MTWRATYHDYLGTTWWAVDEVDGKGRFMRNIVLCDDDEALAQRIAKLPELESIVDTVPCTADGVYWIPGRDVTFFHPEEAGSQDDVSIEDDRWVAWWWVVDRETGGSRGRFHDIGECYSTREANEAAREEAGS